MSEEKKAPTVLPPDPTKIKTLEDLVFVGQIERPFDIFGLKIVLRNLDFDDTHKSFDLMTGKNEISQMMSNKKETLARAVVSINGIRPTPQYELKEGKQVEVATATDQMKKVLGKFSEPLINVLYEKYLEVLKEVQDSIDQFPNSLTTLGAEAAGK
jgi:hypothetical protein